MWGVDYKKRMEDLLFEDMTEYLRSRDLAHVYEMPVLAYADADAPGFMRLFEEGITMHPKEIYRPGRTVIISFLPFVAEYVGSNFDNGKDISDEWIFTYENAILISSHINGVIQKALEGMGREVSLTNLPGDWNEEKFGPEWSHKCAAYIAGMGKFGPAGSFEVEGHGSLGRFNSIITELPMDTGSSSDDPDEIVATIRRQSLYQGEDDVYVSPEKQQKCPADAIDDCGINRSICQDFCKSLGQPVPEAEVCAKCFNI